MVKLINVTPRSGYKLLLEYNDGVIGEIDLSHLIGQGVFRAWRDARLFEAVTIGKHGELHWSEDLELCADALYLQITGKSAEELFPNLRAAADA